MWPTDRKHESIFTLLLYLYLHKHKHWEMITKTRLVFDCLCIGLCREHLSLSWHLPHQYASRYVDEISTGCQSLNRFSPSTLHSYRLRTTAWTIWWENRLLGCQEKLFRPHKSVTVFRVNILDAHKGHTHSTISRKISLVTTSTLRLWYTHFFYLDSIFTIWAGIWFLSAGRLVSLYMNTYVRFWLRNFSIYMNIHTAIFYDDD